MSRPRALAVGDSMEWQTDAACRGRMSLFYGPPREEPEVRHRRERRAKQVCELCPVLRPCARFALSTREPYGVWGGLTEREREKVRSLNRAQAAALAQLRLAQSDRRAESG